MVINDRYKETHNPLVSILCTTYNHEKYIDKALRSMLIQETQFDYEILINDDCSTDETTRIVKDYENKYKCIRAYYHDENQYSKGIRALPQLIHNAKGKYIAICEGDDYFCDKHKIQKQVDALESHKNCVACIHSALRVNEKGNKILGRRRPPVQKEVLNPKDIVYSVGRLYSLNSLMCYKSSICDLGELYYQCNVGDIPIALHLAAKGDFVYLNDDMSAYRVGAIGSWTKRMQYDSIKSAANMDNFISTLNKFDEITNYLYHTEVEERKLFYIYAKSFVEKNFKLYINKNFKQYRRELPFRNKIGFYYACIKKCMEKLINVRE